MPLFESFTTEELIRWFDPAHADPFTMELFLRYVSVINTLADIHCDLEQLEISLKNARDPAPMLQQLMEETSDAYA